MENQLVELTTETAMEVFTGDNGLDSYVQQVVDEVNSFEHDLSTGAGRARTISLASKVAKIKVKYDDCGKELVASWKKDASTVDKARKKMRDTLDELKVLARKPVTDWEVEQEEIKAKKIADDLAENEAKEKDILWDFALMELKLFNIELAAKEKKRIADEVAAQARLKQAQIDNDILIAAAATVEAERLAQEKINNAKIAEQKAIDDKIKADADLLAAQAREKLLSEQAEKTRLNNEWLSYISEAYEYNEKLNAEARLKYQQGLAEVSRLAAIETERLAGIERQRLAQQKLDDEEAARMADANNIRLINRAIFAALTVAGLDKESATLATQALIDNKIPHTQINY